MFDMNLTTHVLDYEEWKQMMKEGGVRNSHYAVCHLTNGDRLALITTIDDECEKYLLKELRMRSLSTYSNWG